MSVLARNSTEKIKLPSGKTVHIPKCVTCFPLWCGEPITNTYGGKAVLTFRGKPLFAELLAILEAPDPSLWCGLRDRVLLATLYNTGARVSEIIGLRVGDVVLGTTSAIRILGKGRKERTVPLWPSTSRQIRAWLKRIDAAPQQSLFPNRSGLRKDPFWNVTEVLQLGQLPYRLRM
jgi:integrase